MLGLSGQVNCWECDLSTDLDICMRPCLCLGALMECICLSFPPGLAPAPSDKSSCTTSPMSSHCSCPGPLSLSHCSTFPTWPREQQGPSVMDLV